MGSLALGIAARGSFWHKLFCWPKNAYTRAMQPRTYPYFTFLLCLSLGAILLASCSRPVVRGERPPAPVSETPYMAADLKKRLWVLPFIEGAPSSPALQNVKGAAILQPRLIEAFNSEKSPFLMPESEQATLKELSVDSATPTTDVARIARGAGVTGFLRGEITSLEIRVETAPVGLLKNKTMELRYVVAYELFDASSGRRIAAGNETQTYTETRSDLFGGGGGIPALDKKVDDLSAAIAPKILARVAPFSEKMGWEGRVLNTDSTRIYINAGRRTGIQVGDIMKVIERSNEIRDPQTGAFVGDAPGRVKGTLKIIQHFGLDGSIAVLQSGGGIRAGDRVELY